MMKKIGFIDYYLDEWHANNYPQWIREASGGDMEVAYAYGQIPSPITGMTTEQWCEKFGVIHCETIEEVVEYSDYLIVLSPDNCEMHETLCRLPLASGKPTYVDKTFAPDLATARRIFAVAEENNTPCYSTSALRFASEYGNVDRKQITAINCWGPGNFEIYSIHQLEPLMMLMEEPAEKVLFQESENWYQLLIAFPDGRRGSISGYRTGSPHAMNLAGKETSRLIMVQPGYFDRFITNMVRFFQTGEIPASHEETLRIMAAREAGVKAQACPGQWVAVESV